MQTTSAHIRSTFCALTVLWLLVLWLPLNAQQIDDREDEGVFTVLLAESDFKKNIYHLDAIFGLQLSHDLEEALHNGVTLTLVIETEVIESRDYIWDHVIAEAQQRYEFSYNPLTEAYQLHNLNSGQRYQMPTLNIVLSHMGNLVDWPLVAADRINPNTHYLGRVRVRIDVETFPVPLRLMAYISEGLDLSSAWLSWPLRPEVIGPSIDLKGRSQAPTAGGDHAP